MIPAPEYFSHLYTYVKWADLRQLDAAMAVSEEEYFKQRGWSFGNVHRIMLHEISAQSGWLDRFVGRPTVWLMSDPQYASRDSIGPLWKLTHAKVTDFMASLTPALLAANITYTTLKGDTFTVPQWQLLVHVCNHAMQHRGQVNSMIQLAGGKPPTVDYAYYVTVAAAS